MKTDKSSIATCSSIASRVQIVSDSDTIADARREAMLDAQAEYEDQQQ